MLDAPCCHSWFHPPAMRDLKYIEEQAIGALQGMFEETNGFKGTSGQVKYLLAYEQDQRKKINPKR